MVDSMKPIDRFLERVPGARQNGSGFKASCPAHHDTHPSLSIREVDGGKVVLCCFTGCTAEAIIEAIGLEMHDLFPDDGRRNGTGRGGNDTLSRTAATPQPSPGQRLQREQQPPATAHPPGCTLAQYAEDKQLPLDFLTGLGLSDFRYLSRPAVRIPYSDTGGDESAVRFRLELAKGDGADNRFKWRRGDKVSLYGLWRLRAAVEAGWVVLVEGESDCHTLWHHGIPALGVPGRQQLERGPRRAALRRDPDRLPRPRAGPWRRLSAGEDRQVPDPRHGAGRRPRCLQGPEWPVSARSRSIPRVIPARP
jgi:hypothetical protein